MCCQSLSGGAADSGKLNVSQGACVLLSCTKTLEEVVYAVSAGEDKPFVVVDVGNSIIQRSIICCRNNFDCRSFDNLGTLCFQLFGESACLCTCASNDNGFAEERLVIEPLQLLTQAYNLTDEEDSRRLHAGCFNVSGSSAEGSNKCALFGMSAPADNGSRAVGTAAVSDELAADFFNIFYTHEENEGVNRGCQALPMDGGFAFSRILVAGNNGKGGSYMTMGNRDTGIFGNSNSTGYAGNELKRQACFTQFDGFFAAAAEYKGVAALQTCYNLTFGSQLYQQLVDIGLAHGVVGAGFANVNHFCVLAGEGQNTRICQTVINNSVCSLQAFLSLESQKARVAGACTD